MTKAGFFTTASWVAWRISEVIWRQKGKQRYSYNLMKRYIRQGLQPSNQMKQNILGSVSLLDFFVFSSCWKEYQNPRQTHRLRPQWVLTLWLRRMGTGLVQPPETTRKMLCSTGKHIQCSAEDNRASYLVSSYLYFSIQVVLIMVMEPHVTSVVVHKQSKHTCEKLKSGTFFQKNPWPSSSQVKRH